MHYTFPKIEHIQDVLPHIEGRSEFVVAEREGYTVINYVVAMSDTFDMYPAGYSGPLSEYDFTGAMRRECRGLIFDKDGKIMSRPFHKFFNVNERDETQSHVLDMSQPHFILEKMDGSMIRPIIVDGYLRLATKMGITHVAMQAEEWLAGQDPSKKEWMRLSVEAGYTPLFEWVSPFNQIVLPYEEADLVYLGTRDTVTGEYLFQENPPFTVVPQYGSVDHSMNDYIERQRQAVDREGDIIRFLDGHMLKIKNDWYVRIHKAIERIVFDRNIVLLILNQEVDDTLPKLPKVQADRVRDFERRFWDAVNKTEFRLTSLFSEALDKYEGDRKRIATEFIPTFSNKVDGGFIFRMLDGNRPMDLILSHIEKQCFTNTKWDLCAEWLGMETKK